MCPAPCVAPNRFRRAVRDLVSPAMLLAFGLASVLSCTEPNPEFLEPGTCGDDALYLQSFGAIHPNRLDVVIVVENTESSRQLRGALRSAASVIIDELAGLDYRVGVVTSSSGGALHVGSGAACPSEGFVTASADDPTSALGCLLDVPEASGTPPAALEAGVLAARADVNPGFIRPEARLLLLVLSMRDDCSSSGRITWSNTYDCEWERGQLTPVGELYGALRRLKADQNAVAYAAIVGPDDGVVFARGTTPEAACVGNYGAALHGPRFRELADLLAPWAYTESVCAPDLSAPLGSAVRQLVGSIESRYCLGRLASQAPREVKLLAPGATEGTVVDGDDGWAYLGAIGACTNGLLAVTREARSNVVSGSTFDVLFCGPKD